MDLDGTLAQWAYPNIGPPTVDAAKAMRTIQDADYRVVIYTSRMSPGIYTLDERIATFKQIRRWLLDWEIPFDEIDFGDQGKRLFAAVVDDKVVQYKGSWEAALPPMLAILAQEEERLARTKRRYDP